MINTIKKRIEEIDKDLAILRENKGKLAETTRAFIFKGLEGEKNGLLFSIVLAEKLKSDLNEDINKIGINYTFGSTQLVNRKEVIKITNKRLEGEE